MNQPNWQHMINFLLETNTQAEIEAKTGIKQGNISKIKNGHNNYSGITYNAGTALKREYNKALKLAVIDDE